MRVLSIRLKILTVRFKSYGSRNRLSKVRTWRQRQRLQVDVCKRGNRRRNGVAANERARVRAVHKVGLGCRAWTGPDLAWVGRIWLGLGHPGLDWLGCARGLLCAAWLLHGLGYGSSGAGLVGLGWARRRSRWPEEERRKEKEKKEKEERKEKERKG